MLKISVKILRSNRGNSMIEIIPVLAIFILLVNFSLGFFGVIHSGILNSIAARNYAFETFRNRASLRYLRDTEDSQADFTYTRSQSRFHVVSNERKPEGNSDIDFVATRRSIQFNLLAMSEDIIPEEKLGTQTDHLGKVKTIAEGARASDVGVDEGVDPVWIRSSYGICLTAACEN
jgi:hypothetical protein